MKIISNNSLIKRNSMIARYSFFVSLAIFGVGLYISFQRPDDPKLLTWTMAALILGFSVSQISIYFQNRYGRSPRPDEVITTSLKGLDDKYTLFHYSTPVSHLVVAPSGVWGIIPYAQKGSITFDGHKWRQKGGSFLLKVFAGDSLGRPDLEATSLQKDIHSILIKGITQEEMPPIRIALLFTDPNVKIEAELSPVPALTSKKLKELLRKIPKQETIPLELTEKIATYLEEAYPKKR